MWFDTIKRKVTKEEFERRGREILEMRFPSKEDKKGAEIIFNDILEDGETEYIDFEYALQIMNDFQKGRIVELGFADEE
jgi:hypothetical protein